LTNFLKKTLDFRSNKWILYHKKNGLKPKENQRS